MNAAMKEQHYSRINDERARRVYDYLCASCELREGGLTDADQMLVYDYAYAEQVKQQLQDDIKARGIGRDQRAAEVLAGQQERAAAAGLLRSAAENPCGTAVDTHEQEGGGFRP